MKPDPRSSEEILRFFHPQNKTYYSIFRWISPNAETLYFYSEKSKSDSHSYSNTNLDPSLSKILKKMSSEQKVKFWYDFLPVEIHGDYGSFLRNKLIQDLQFPLEKNLTKRWMTELKLKVLGLHPICMIVKSKPIFHKIISSNHLFLDKPSFLKLKKQFGIIKTNVFDQSESESWEEMKNVYRDFYGKFVISSHIFFLIYKKEIYWNIAFTNHFQDKKSQSLKMLFDSWISYSVPNTYLLEYSKIHPYLIEKKISDELYICNPLFVNLILNDLL